MKCYQLKENNREDDTIVAISTPPGMGGISIVRLSGPQSIEIASKIFLYKGKAKKNPNEYRSHCLYYGTIVQPWDDRVVDEVLLTIMRKPKTYTREDVVEINCHGGFLVVNKVLEIACKLGARIAEPGEFTKLAFLNGRIDLSQAEAVIDIIKSSNEKSLQSSLYQLSGGLKEKINHLKNKIVDLNVRIEAPLDFPDQGIAEIKKEEIKKIINECSSEVNKLLDTVQYGQIIKEGINAIILGKTNVGKSSLFNLLLKRNRSIVTSLPGTTRDLIEESININGITFHLIDTAGMKIPENIVEQISLKRVREYMEFAQLFIVMFDNSRPIDSDDIKLMKKIESYHNRNINIILVINKIDLPPGMDISELRSRFSQNDFVTMSIKKKIGIDTLLEKMTNLILSDINIPDEELIINNKRHLNCLLQAKNCLNKLRSSLEEGIPLDFVAMDLKYIANQLANITGESCDEEIISGIFSKFCIGK
ncbi:MAG: tRNA uridine-5-carboxymethylaminomethyl(34) synthesis GTPase MnmE [Candidatus Atribacteria bacterium]|nr:tRNA uridine-5-carboxymethylaminomethyl(34) synthesis GTPase MnmE [Candidatus Atribacteria bacterium]